MSFLAFQVWNFAAFRFVAFFLKRINFREFPNDISPLTRFLEGVTRVGILAHGLILRHDKRFDLVVLCCRKPTEKDLNRVVKTISSHFEVNETKIVENCVENRVENCVENSVENCVENCVENRVENR